MMLKIGMTMVTMAGLLAAGYCGYKLWMTHQIDELVSLIVAVLFIEGAVLSFIGCIKKNKGF